jgi:hypothetical protein
MSSKFDGNNFFNAFFIFLKFSFRRGFQRFSWSFYIKFSIFSNWFFEILTYQTSIKRFRPRTCFSTKYQQQQKLIFKILDINYCASWVEFKLIFLLEEFLKPLSVFPYCPGYWNRTTKCLLLKYKEVSGLYWENSLRKVEF